MRPTFDPSWQPDLDLIRAYVGRVEWRFAKTMAWCPHFYNVIHWNPREYPGFTELALAIYDRGYDEQWPQPHEVELLQRARPRVQRYFALDGWKYWTGATPAAAELVNRARLPGNLGSAP